ncbi:hypothetical protein M427DRAFT_67250 [Gonapodya prolifera JEL478]|uniref:Uncharacterized protein n=1 Tax=Gonapodya prolifera (strain JEL478) TaxID=1344416 RepID=A0A139AQS4_GONPJ|nr:hypothetical protein M427DRAFT_67250 [Gonapodya prolifera JEL478]|eukprot:KXS19086.1 hypothetical protein M427DRAFT_67250 [Gonapodya prolifera JEL478]
MAPRRPPPSSHMDSRSWEQPESRNISVENWSYRLVDRQQQKQYQGMPPPLREEYHWAAKQDLPRRKSNRAMVIGISIFAVVATAAIIAGFVVALRPSQASSSSGIQLSAANVSSSVVASKSSSSSSTLRTSSSARASSTSSLVPVRTIANPGQISSSVLPTTARVTAAATRTSTASLAPIFLNSTKGVEGDITGAALEQCIASLPWAPYTYFKPFSNLNPGDDIADVEYCITDAAGPCGQGIYNGSVTNCSLTFETFCYYNRASGQFLQSQRFTGTNPPAKYFNCGQEECGAVATC